MPNRITISGKWQLKIDTTELATAAAPTQDNTRVAHVPMFDIPTVIVGGVLHKIDWM